MVLSSEDWSSEEERSEGDHVKRPQADWLAELASNFYGAIESLPHREQKGYREGQREVADKRRNAQTNERLLRLRVK
jgi:hypothetical protein